MTSEINLFIQRYVEELRNNNAAVFIGAGFSLDSGCVDWKGLLKKFAEEIRLDINKETDLVTVAQYHFNDHNNRSELNNSILQNFTTSSRVEEKHRILARLPIFTYWTTNYDSLIEDALKTEHKVVDVKYCNEQLSIATPKRNAIVYKMHGDKSNPNETVILKDDYERYYRSHAPFLTALSGDLISKTFLFLGFSFTDPNIDYILSRIRVEYSQGNQRQHYALMRKVSQKELSEDEYNYAVIKQELFIKDIKRFGIKVLLIDDYSEITEILREIERKLYRNNIFISGSASQYGDFTEKEAIDFITLLSNCLIKNDYNLISGFGLGVGSAVITGALNEIYMNCKSINNDRLVLRPFPQGIVNDETRRFLWKQYREDMISRAGISIFLFGNKSLNGSVVNADGVISEFEIAKELGNLIVPVGCTGYAAKSNLGYCFF